MRRKAFSPERFGGELSAHRPAAHVRGGEGVTVSLSSHTSPDNEEEEEDKAAGHLVLNRR